VKIALAQINTTIGDYAGNKARILEAVERARSDGADVCVFPELALCGYPPMDLLQRTSFLRNHQDALDELATEIRGIDVVIGALASAPEDGIRPVSNAALVLRDGKVVATQRKTLLPTYDVFDEARYFEPGRKRRVQDVGGRRVGVAICEDAWSGDFWGEARPYGVDPVAELVELGAELLIIVSASPWQQEKSEFRERMLTHASQQHGVPLVFVNLVGGNDELIFDGGSFVASANGNVTHRLSMFEEDYAVADVFEAGDPEPAAERIKQLEKALVLGVRDYLHKLGMSTAVIGLSGGIDSAVTAYIAARALGPENVKGILMPGPFSSTHSVTDAERLVENLGIQHKIVPIESIYKGFLEQFQVLFGAEESYGLTQENLQARVRGTLLMAVSNYEGRIVLATGNKSELSVGYTTLYGDLVGGLAVLGDVLKRDVYALARFANREREQIPPGTIDKPPSAELAPDQFDTDSLPEYAVLDEILEQVIENRRPSTRIRIPDGGSADTLDWVLRALDRNEYKRRQAPLVLRVSDKAFGTGRRIPIVHRTKWGI